MGREMRDDLAAATLKAYNSDRRVVEMWLIENGYSSEIDHKNLLSYLKAHRLQLAPSTLTRRAFALASIMKSEEQKTPVGPDVRAFLCGIKRQTTWNSLAAIPLVLDDLVKILKVIPCDTLIGIRDRALLSVGWFGAFRRSEIVSLEMRDVRFEKEGIVIIIRRSKTHRQSRDVAVPFQADEVCPVAALTAWIRASQSGREGFLFRGFRYRTLTKNPLTGASVGKILKKWTKEAGIDVNFSAHSLRSGYITEAAMSGQSVWAIMKVSRHSSPRGVQVYIRDRSPWVHNPSLHLTDRLKK